MDIAWVSHTYWKRAWHDVCTHHELWRQLPAEMKHAVCKYLYIAYSSSLHAWDLYSGAPERERWEMWENNPSFVGYTPPFVPTRVATARVFGARLGGNAHVNEPDRRPPPNYDKRQQRWEKQNKRWK